MPGEHAKKFDLWLRTTDNYPHTLTKTQHKVITGLMDEALDHRLDHEAFDRLHWFIEKKDKCPTCNDDRCGCVFHQQSCKHIIAEYMEEIEREGR